MTNQSTDEVLDDELLTRDGRKKWDRSVQGELHAKTAQSLCPKLNYALRTTTMVYNSIVKASFQSYQKEKTQSTHKHI